MQCGTTEGTQCNSCRHQIRSGNLIWYNVVCAILDSHNESMPYCRSVNENNNCPQFHRGRFTAVDDLNSTEATNASFIQKLYVKQNEIER